MGALPCTTEGDFVTLDTTSSQDCIEVRYHEKLRRGLS